MVERIILEHQFYDMLIGSLAPMGSFRFLSDNLMALGQCLRLTIFENGKRKAISRPQANERLFVVHG
jgi:hypothetical protein